MKKLICTIIFGLILISSIFTIVKIVWAEIDIAKLVSGKILLQVQSYGEAWYVNPANNKKYFLGRPTDAFNLMKNLGLGISNENLKKIPIGVLPSNNTDMDNDGLPDTLEAALATNPKNADTDGDGHDDKKEILLNFNPLAVGPTKIDLNFVKLNLGKIFIQTEGSGQAWYLNPSDQKRYFLGSPKDAFEIMKRLAIGITNQNISKLVIGNISQPISSSSLQNNSQPTTPIANSTSAANTISAAAEAIRRANTASLNAIFTPAAQPIAKYTINYLNNEGRLILGNILSGSSLSSSSENEKIYSNELYFSLSGEKVRVNFRVLKQPDGSWLLANL